MSEAKTDTVVLKGEIGIPQRDGTNVVLPAGHVLTKEQAVALVKAGLLDGATGKAPAKKAEEK